MRAGHDERSAVLGRRGASPGDAVYGLGLIGALVYFWQQADTFWGYVLSVLKALVWPAFLVYEAFGALLG